ISDPPSRRVPPCWTAVAVAFPPCRPIPLVCVCPRPGIRSPARGGQPRDSCDGVCRRALPRLWLYCRFVFFGMVCALGAAVCYGTATVLQNRKSTRLNSSHVKISYAVFCLKKKRPNH